MRVSRFHCQLGVDGFKTGVFQEFHYCTSWCQRGLRYFAVQLNSLAEKEKGSSGYTWGNGRELGGSARGIPSRAPSLTLAEGRPSSFWSENRTSKEEQIWDGRLETAGERNATKGAVEIIKSLKKNQCQLCPQRSPLLPPKNATRQNHMQLCI